MKFTAGPETFLDCPKAAFRIGRVGWGGDLASCVGKRTVHRAAKAFQFTLALSANRPEPKPDCH